MHEDMCINLGGDLYFSVGLHECHGEQLGHGLLEVGPAAGGGLGADERLYVVGQARAAPRGAVAVVLIHLLQLLH